MKKETNVRETFKRRLSQLRAESGLSQSKLAKQLEISPATIGYYENGDRLPDIDIVARIASFFDVTADYLLGFSNARTTERNMKTACEITGLSEESIKNIQKTKKMLDKKSNKVDISMKKCIDGVEPYEVLNLFLSSEAFREILYNFFDMSGNYKALFLLQFLFCELETEEVESHEEYERIMTSILEKHPFLEAFLVQEDEKPPCVFDYLSTCDFLGDQADLSEYRVTKCMRYMFEEYRKMAMNHGYALAEKCFKEEERKHRNKEQEDSHGKTNI